MALIWKCVGLIELKMSWKQDTNAIFCRFIDQNIRKKECSTGDSLSVYWKSISVPEVKSLIKIHIWIPTEMEKDH